MPVVSKTFRRSIFLSILLSLPGYAFEKNQYFRGISEGFEMGRVARSDLNQDGIQEVVVCYRSRREPKDGGLLILNNQSDTARVLWHVAFENYFPERVSSNGSVLTVELVHSKNGTRLRKAWVHGEDYHFRGTQGDPFAKMTIKASSTLRADKISVAHVFDGDPKSNWAEGASGTGVSESLNFEFAAPVDLAMIGVLHGNFQSKRSWYDNNRVHRAEVTIETHAERYDKDSDMDFEKDLGLSLYGDRVDLTFSNRPVMRYTRLCKRDAISLEIRIASVLLGEKTDDTYVAEIDFVQWIPESVITGQPKKNSGTEEKKKVPKAQIKDDEEDWTEDDF
jgi:hypothetical protein